MSAIVADRQVRSAISFFGNTIMQLSEIIEQSASSKDGSVLTLRPGSIATVNQKKAHSISNSVIFRGLPVPKLWPDVLDAAQQSKHPLVILNNLEHLDRTCQTFFAKLDSDFLTHPRYLEINSYGPASVLRGFRNYVRDPMSHPRFSSNVQAIYENLLETPKITAVRLGFAVKKPLEKIDVVNKFIANVFLRGCIKDGSSRFNPDGRELEVPQRVFESLYSRILTSEIDLSHETGSGVNQSNDSPFVSNPHKNWWRITLQHDFDVTPLICYLAEQHPKSVCRISHSQSAFPYGDILSTIPSISEIFEEHPESASLNSQGGDSPLHLFREKIRPVLVGLLWPVFSDISQFYKTTRASAYPIKEFLRKVMLLG
ncbi:hypothetical protein B0J17DRAFT_772485 [Rhizoctonia solani]|nr:hypothetical protein B0J17DRAFT_772485 [Rhizoctonia solani]